VVFWGVGKWCWMLWESGTAYALNSAGIVDDKTLFEAAGLNRKTASAYEQLLVNLMVIDRVPAWQAFRQGRGTSHRAASVRARRAHPGRADRYPLGVGRARIASAKRSHRLAFSICAAPPWPSSSRSP